MYAEALEEGAVLATSSADVEDATVRDDLDDGTRQAVIKEVVEGWPCRVWAESKRSVSRALVAKAPLTNRHKLRGVYATKSARVAGFDAISISVRSSVQGKRRGQR